MNSKIFVFAFILISKTTLACVDDERSSTRMVYATTCASIFQIMTAISNENEKLGEYFVGHAKMANYAASIYGESIIGEVPTPKVLAMGRDFEMTLIDSSYKMCPQYYQDKLKNCIGWVYELKKFIDNAEQISGNTINEKSLREALLSFGPQPQSKHSYPHNDFEPLRVVMNNAYSRWVQIGKPKPLDIDRIRKQSKETFNPYEGLSK